MIPPTRPINTSVTPQPPADGQAQAYAWYYVPVVRPGPSTADHDLAARAGTCARATEETGILAPTANDDRVR